VFRRGQEQANIGTDRGYSPAARMNSFWILCLLLRLISRTLYPSPPVRCSPFQAVDTTHFSHPWGTESTRTAETPGLFWLSGGGVWILSLLLSPVRTLGMLRGPMDQWTNEPGIMRTAFLSGMTKWPPDFSFSPQCPGHAPRFSR